MQGKFEDNINNKLNDFSLTPNDRIWAEVEAALPKKEKRRGIIWFWWLGLPLTGAALLGIIFFFRDNTLLNTNINTHTINTASKPTIKKKEGITERKGDLAKVYKEGIVLGNKTLSTIVLPQHTEKLSRKESKGTVVNIEKKKSQIKDANAKGDQAAPISEKQSNSNKGPIQTEETALVSNELSINKKDTSKQDTTALVKAGKANILLNPKTDSADMATTKKTDTSLPKKKHQWYFTVGGGLMAETDKAFYGGSNYIAYTGITSSSSTYTAANGNGLYANPIHGFSLTAGVTYQLKLAKRWQLETGLLYNYLQNTQAVGSKIRDSMPSGFDNNYLYQWGNAGSIHNHTHILKLPLQLQYLLFPKQNLYLVAGTTIGYQMQYQWLSNDAGYEVYYYKKTLQNRLQVNVSLGLRMQVNNTWQFTLLAEQAVTPIQHGTDYSKYWRQASIQVSYPINSIIKHKK